MLKFTQDANPWNGVGFGAKPTLDYDTGYRYLMSLIIVSVAKTAATAGFTSAKYTDFLDLLQLRVDTHARRDHTISELDQIQTRWSPLLAVQAIDGIANDLVTAVADVINGADTTRVTTFIIPVCFMDPTRDSYSARMAFAWPTKWASGRVAKIQAALTVLPAPAGFANLAIRSQHIYDLTTGPVINGKDSMPIVQFYRDDVVYSSVNVTIDKWPFPFKDGNGNGTSLQQISFFSPAGDDVGQFEIKTDSLSVRKGTKQTADTEMNSFGWNPDGIGSDRFDLAFDFTDDPTDALPLLGVGKLRAALILVAAAAGNKNLVSISQVFQDALA